MAMSPPAVNATVRHRGEMKKLVWIGLFLEISPVLAFALLALLHPIGDPQESGNLLVRVLDYQGTYWIRHAIPVPPPLLLAGVCLLILLWLRSRLASALAGSIAGIVLLGLWSLIMVVPLFVHVN
jgi:hypothetical protein